MSEHFRQLYAHLRSIISRFAVGSWDELTRAELTLLYPFWVIYLVVLGIIQKRGLIRAGSLAFTTILSIIPTLTVATILLTASGGGNAKFFEVIQNYLLPYAGPQITTHLHAFIDRQGGTAGGIGSVVIIFLGITLFNNIEHAFNDIWRIQKRRQFFSKFLIFYALITLAPLLVTISIVQTARVQFFVEHVPFLASLGSKALSVGLAMVVFTLGNKLLPNTRVNWKPALASGLVIAIAFELTKVGFNIYIDNFVLETYERVYGALYLVPIFLVWIFVCWIIVLSGAEMTYTIQNMRTLLVPERVRRLATKRDREFDPLIGVEVFVPIAQAFHNGQGPIQLDSIAAQASVPAALAEQVLGALIRSKLVTAIGLSDDRTAYLPGRPLKNIRVQDLIEACRSKDSTLDDARFIDALRLVHQDAERDLFGELTGESLVDTRDAMRLKLFTRSIHQTMAANTSAQSEADTAPSTLDTSPDDATTLDLRRIRDDLDVLAAPSDTAQAADASTDTNDEAAEDTPEPTPSPIDALASL